MTRPRRSTTPPQLALGSLLEGEDADPSLVLARRHRATHVLGVDEVGRGPLAGPVITAAVLIRVGQSLPEGVADSKTLSAAQRQALLQPIRDAAVAHALGEATVAEIDAINILQASLLAMKRAALSAWRLAGQPRCVVLVDGRELIPDLGLPQHAVVGGDARCMAIAGASILAKEHRDALLLDLHTLHPQYGFERHKGYATAEHLLALREHGPCGHHRRSFEPVKGFLLSGHWGGGGGARQQEELW